MTQRESWDPEMAPEVAVPRPASVLGVAKLTTLTTRGRPCQLRSASTTGAKPDTGPYNREKLTGTAPPLKIESSPALTLFQPRRGRVK